MTGPIACPCCAANYADERARATGRGIPSRSNATIAALALVQRYGIETAVQALCSHHAPWLAKASAAIAARAAS